MVVWLHDKTKYQTPPLKNIQGPRLDPGRATGPRRRSVWFTALAAAVSWDAPADDANGSATKVEAAAACALSCKEDFYSYNTAFLLIN